VLIHNLIIDSWCIGKYHLQSKSELIYQMKAGV